MIKGYQIHLCTCSNKQIPHSNTAMRLGWLWPFCSIFIPPDNEEIEVYRYTTIYDAELDQLSKKMEVINFLNQINKDVNCYEQWIRFDTFENYGMLKLFITQSSLSFPCFLTSFHILWFKWLPDFSAFEKKCSNERSKDKIQNQQQKCPNKKNNKEKKGKHKFSLLIITAILLFSREFEKCLCLSNNIKLSANKKLAITTVYPGVFLYHNICENE